MMLRIITILTVVSFCALLFVLFTTNPIEAGLPGMLSVFVLGYMSLLGAVTFLLYYGSRFTAVLLRVFGRRPSPERLSLGKAYVYASVLAVLPMIAVGLRSTGNVEWYELGLLILFGIIGMVYVARRT